MCVCVCVCVCVLCTHIRPVTLFFRFGRVQFSNTIAGVQEMRQTDGTGEVIRTTHILDTLLEHEHVIRVQIRCKKKENEVKCYIS